MKNFVLDLDQTLISAEPTEEYNYKKNKTKQKQFVFHNMEDYYIVFERPYLQEFLDYLFKNFNVTIWTAASKDYALYIIENVILKNKPERKIDYVFFSYHCNISKNKKKRSKELEMLWDIYKLKDYNKDNTYILDDYDDVYKYQPNNAIVAKPFEFQEDNSPNDDFLKRLIPRLDLLKENKITIKEINEQLNG